MTINKAIDHFGWKFKNVWQPTKKDVEAYNAILDYIDLQQTNNLSENESLAKLFIAYFIMIVKRHGISSKEALNTIDDILKRSVYNWCKVLQSQVKVMHLATIGESYDLNEWNITKIDEHNQKILQDYSQEITEAIQKQTKEEDIIKWVEGIVNGIINEYEK